MCDDGWSPESGPVLNEAVQPELEGLARVLKMSQALALRARVVLWCVCKAIQVADRFQLYMM